MFGLGLYKPMTLFSADIIVKQKISAAWSLASMGIAVTAVLVGAFIALRYSVVITPSLLRKWKGEEKRREGKWVFEIPVRVPEEEIALLLDFIKHRLPGYNFDYDMRIERIKQVEMETSEGIQKSIHFTSYGGHGADGFIIHNELIMSREKGKTNYTLNIVSLGDRDKAYHIASFMRWLLLEWSARKRKSEA